MESTSDAGQGPNGNEKRQDRVIARSVFVAGSLLTAVWVVALILILRWLIESVF
jgi:hypothetical protein